MQVRLKYFWMIHILKTVEYDSLGFTCTWWIKPLNLFSQLIRSETCNVTSDSVSGQEGEHKEGVDPLLSDWFHLRVIETELPHPGRKDRRMRSCRGQWRTLIHRDGRTQSGRWSSWSSWCWGRSGSVWWWISAADWSSPPATSAPGLRSAWGPHRDSIPEPPAGWGRALPSCSSSVVMRGCEKIKKN